MSIAREPSIRTAPPPPTGNGAESRSPLWAVLAVAFLASIGTGVVTNGIYFITKHGYGFSEARNYSLGVVMGITYVAGSLGAGPILRWLRASRRLTTRAALGALLGALGILCIIPLAGRGAAAPWPIWLLIALYTPLTGILWPTIESYVSGGRRGGDLRSAIGRFNYTWSGAIVVAYFCVSPTLGRGPESPGGAPNHWPAIVITALGVLHVLTIAPLIAFRREPGRHLEDTHEPHPASYQQLLVTFRILLPTSYIVVTALIPYLPGAFDRLGVPTELHMALAATWLAARVGAFICLERWHGWHGRWYPPILGGVLMLAGFGITVLAPTMPEPGAGAIILTIAGLAAFGVGMAVIYSGALYYAMEVGDARVEAGGTHEALIGVGYTVGPLLGLLAVGAEAGGWLPRRSFEYALLTTVALVAVGAAARRRVALLEDRAPGPTAPRLLSLRRGIPRHQRRDEAIRR